MQDGNRFGFSLSLYLNRSPVLPRGSLRLVNEGRDFTTLRHPDTGTLGIFNELLLFLCGTVQVFITITFSGFDG